MTAKEMIDFVEKAYSEGNMPVWDYKKFKEEFREKTAKEMFENIKRYKVVKYENNEDLIMYQLVEDYYYNDYIYHLKGQYLEIIFDKKHQYLNIVQEDCENYRTITSILNMEIYKAINKQIEELGWK